MAWFTLFLVLLLELIFLISLLIQANKYLLIKTNYQTLRLTYLHSAKQIVLLFIMGLVAILGLLVSAVATSRFCVATNGKTFYF